MLNKYEILKSFEQREQGTVDADTALIAFSESRLLLSILCRCGDGGRDESIGPSSAGLELTVQDDFHLAEVIVSMVSALFTGQGRSDQSQASSEEYMQEADQAPEPSSSESLQMETVHRIINQRVVDRRRLLPPEKAMVHHLLALHHSNRVASHSILFPFYSRIILLMLCIDHHSDCVTRLGNDLWISESYAIS